MWIGRVPIFRRAAAWSYRCADYLEVLVLASRGGTPQAEQDEVRSAAAAGSSRLSGHSSLERNQRCRCCFPDYFALLGAPDAGRLGNSIVMSSRSRAM